MERFKQSFVIMVTMILSCTMTKGRTFHCRFCFTIKMELMIRCCFTAFFAFYIEKFNIGVCSPFACSHAVQVKEFLNFLIYIF